MNPRLFIPLLFVFGCASLLAQPKIVSITYDGDVAILTRNTPPDGIVYYWQGSSCGTLMNHSGSTTLASSDGTYYLREYNSSSSTWATSCASTNVLFPDNTPPVLSNVTTGPIEVGTDIMATSNEDGMLYLVPDGTAANLGAITAADVASVAVTANVAGTLSTSGIAFGDYVVYAVDGSNNVSTASPAITVSAATYIDLNNMDQHQVLLYPVNVIDILHIKSNLQVVSVKVYTLNGTRVMNINTPTDHVDMSGLSAGVYILNLTLEDQGIYNGKVTKR